MKPTDDKHRTLRYACAAAAHMANRAYCIALGDNSQPPWNEAPGWQIQSALDGVDGVLAGNGPAESHESWLRNKQRGGWVYGPTKDPEKKTHPCMVPYGDLPEAQRKKDEIFVDTVHAIVEAIGP